MTDPDAPEPPITEVDVVALPAPIAADLLEAARCCTFGAYRAAGLLARRAVEQVAVLHRVPLDRRTLDHKLGWLLGDGHVPRERASDARVVRDIGTAAAHGGEALTRAEANMVVRSALAVSRAALLGDC